MAYEVRWRVPSKRRRLIGYSRCVTSVRVSEEYSKKYAIQLGFAACRRTCVMGKWLKKMCRQRGWKVNWLLKWFFSFHREWALEGFCRLISKWAWFTDAMIRIVSMLPNFTIFSQAVAIRI